MIHALPRPVNWHWPATFGSLRHRDYRIWWLGLLVSLVGTWMQSVAQGWLVLDLTGSPVSLGTVTALQFLPVLLLALPGGVVADWFPRRRLIFVTQSAALLQAVVLSVLVLGGLVQLWHLYVLALVLGLVNAFDQPARQAFVGEQVPREDLPNAVGLNSTLFNTARIVGPALGGVLIARFGVGICFLFNAFSFAAVLVGLTLLRPRPTAATPAPGPLRHDLVGQLGEGLAFVRRTPAALLPLALMGVIGTLGYNFSVVLPLLARFALGTGPGGFGALTAAMGVGSLVGALVVASRRRTSLRVILLGAAAFSLLELGVAAAPGYALALALLAGLGAAGIIFTTGINTTLQLGTPARLRGRVLSLYLLLFAGTTPIGGFLTGLVADRLGIRWTLALEALACGAAVLVIALVARARAAELRAAETRPAPA